MGNAKRVADDLSQGQVWIDAPVLVLRHLIFASQTLPGWQSDSVLIYAAESDLFHSPGHLPYVTLAIDGRSETLR